MAPKSKRSSLGQRASRELKRLIDAKERNEQKCRKYLGYESVEQELLFREHVLEKVVYREPDLQTSSGISDYVISGLIRGGTKNLCRAYVWELKAPQCPIFTRDTQNRLCPSADLVKAENQLLNYVHQIRGDDVLRTRFRVLSPFDVRFGGIIIGSSENLVSGNISLCKKEQLYEDAYRIRHEYFYNRAGITLVNWNDVCDCLGGIYSDVSKKSVKPHHEFRARRIDRGARYFGQELRVN